VRNEKEVPKAIKRLFQSVINWKFSTTTRQFEGFPFYRFRSAASRNKMVHVFLNDRVTAIKVDTFQRTMFPILVIHPTGNQRAPVIDSAGLAHVGLPCALTALESKEAKKQFRRSLFTVIRRLLQLEHERVLTSSRLSRDLLDDKPVDYDEWKFEADVYNVIRRLLPYSYKWGGKNKPDGFISFTDFENNDLKKPLKYNFSYDAKYSKTTYEFAIKEFRQMFDYILGLGNSNQLKLEGNQHDGHIIISNSIDESSMRGASDFLWSEHRLGSSRPGFLLVFMRDEFLVRTWDMVHDRREEVAKRWMLFPQALMRAIKTNEIDRYSLLDGEAATTMMDWLIRQPTIENPLNNELLLEDLTELIDMRMRIRKRATDVSAN
jgi:hypothetical protein